MNVLQGIAPTNPRALLTAGAVVIGIIGLYLATPSSPTPSSPIILTPADHASGLFNTHLAPLCRLQKRLHLSDPSATPPTLFEYLGINPNSYPFDNDDAITLAWAKRKRSLLDQGRDTGLLDAVTGALLVPGRADTYVKVVMPRLVGVSGREKKVAALKDVCQGYW